MAERCVGRRAFVAAGLLLGGIGGPAIAQELSENALQPDPRDLRRQGHLDAGPEEARHEPPLRPP